jgi:hypothetical protein
LTNYFSIFVMHVVDETRIEKLSEVDCRNLNLGLATKARVYKLRAKSEAQESHFVLSKV